MMGTRKPYSDAFKQEAVNLVTEQGMKHLQVARDLGIDPETLRRWLREQVADAATPLAARPAGAELRQLQRENAQLRMERDILKKALGIFSRMPE